MHFNQSLSLRHVFMYFRYVRLTELIQIFPDLRGEDIQDASKNQRSYLTYAPLRLLRKKKKCDLGLDELVLDFWVATNSSSEDR